MLSPMSRAGFRDKKNFSPDHNETGEFGYMTPLQVLHQEFTLLNLNSPYFKIEKVKIIFIYQTNISNTNVFLDFCYCKDYTWYRL